MHHPTDDVARMRVGPSILLYLLALAPVLTGQDASVGWSQRFWTMEEGLPQNSVTDIEQTSDGYLWLSTFGGLARFDGVRFEVFDLGTNPELGSNRVWQLHAARNGTLWIGTDAGVCRMDGNRITAVPGSHGDALGRISCIEEDIDGSLWLGGDSFAVVRGSSCEQFPLPAPDCKIADLHRLDGRWHASTNLGVFVWQDDTWRSLEGQPQGRTLAGGIRRVANRTILATGHRGLFVRSEEDPTRWQAVRDSARIRFPWDFLDLGDGDYWFGTERGVFVLDSALLELSQFSLDSSRPNVRVRAIHRDRDGSVWIGTGGCGLVRARPTPVRKFDNPRGQNAVIAVARSSKGGVWTAWNFGRVSHCDGNSLTDQIPQRAQALAEAPDGTLWFGNMAGLHYADKTAPHTIEQYELDPNSLLFVGTTLWIGATTGEVHVIRDGELSEVPLEETRGPTRILGQTRDGRIWLGMRSMIWIYEEGKTPLRLDEAHGLPRGEVRSLHEDSEGRVWIGSYGGGLCLWEEGRFRCLDRSHGLLDNSVSNVQEQHGKFWINSNRGVFCIKTAEINRHLDGFSPRVQCRGFDTPEANSGHGFATAEGTLWFPTIDGLVRIDPHRDLGGDILSPLVAIERIVANGRDITGIDDRTAKPGRGDLTFRFTGFSSADPDGIEFRYLLEGYDEDWRFDDGSRTANYTNLPPGDYTLVVRARSSSGAWSTPTKASVFLRPHFWQTAWFAWLGVALLCLSLFALHAARTKSLAVRNSLLRDEIAERERAEARYRDVVQTATDAILRIDDDSRIGFANAASEVVFGDAAEELIGVPLSRLVPDWDRSDSHEGDLYAMRRDGQRIPVEVSIGGQEQCDANGHRTTVIVRDVSARRAAEDEKRHLEAEIAESSKMEAVGRLAGGISHDFNNILTAVLGATSLIRDAQDDHSPDETTLKAVEVVENCARRGADLTHQLLAFSRQQRLEPLVVDPAKILIGIEEILRRLTPASVEVEFRLDDDAGNVRVDPTQLERVVVNLVINSAEAMRDHGGTIGISTSHITNSERERVRIRVEDDGPGIAPDVLPHVFEPFFSTKGDSGGNGLGLSTARGIIEQSGGSLSVASSDRGAVFDIELPRIDAPVSPMPESTVVIPRPNPLDKQSPLGDATDTAHSKSPSSAERTVEIERIAGPTPAEGTGRSKTVVMIVDDDVAVTQTTSRLLEQKGYQVLSATSSRDALRISQQLSQEPIDILLTDWIMPDMSGPALAARLRSDWPNIQVILMTGYHRTDHAEEVLIEDYSVVVKPFAIDDLVEALLPAQTEQRP